MNKTSPTPTLVKLDADESWEKVRTAVEEGEWSEELKEYLRAVHVVRRHALFDLALEQRSWDWMLTLFMQGFGTRRLREVVDIALNEGVWYFLKRAVFQRWSLFETALLTTILSAALDLQLWGVLSDIGPGLSHDIDLLLFDRAITMKCGADTSSTSDLTHPEGLAFQSDTAKRWTFVFESYITVREEEDMQSTLKFRSKRAIDPIRRKRAFGACFIDYCETRDQDVGSIFLEHFCQIPEHLQEVYFNAAVGKEIFDLAADILEKCLDWTEKDDEADNKKSQLTMKKQAKSKEKNAVRTSKLETRCLKMDTWKGLLFEAALQKHKFDVVHRLLDIGLAPDMLSRALRAAVTAEQWQEVSCWLPGVDDKSTCDWVVSTALLNETGQAAVVNALIRCKQPLIRHALLVSMEAGLWELVVRIFFVLDTRMDIAPFQVSEKEYEKAMESLCPEWSEALLKLLTVSWDNVQQLTPSKHVDEIRNHLVVLVRLPMALPVPPETQLAKYIHAVDAFLSTFNQRVLEQERCADFSLANIMEHLRWCILYCAEDCFKNGIVPTIGIAATVDKAIIVLLLRQNFNQQIKSYVWSYFITKKFDWTIIEKVGIAHMSEAQRSIILDRAFACAKYELAESLITCGVSAGRMKVWLPVMMKTPCCQLLKLMFVQGLIVEDAHPNLSIFASAQPAVQDDDICVAVERGDWSTVLNSINERTHQKYICFAVEFALMAKAWFEVIRLLKYLTIPAALKALLAQALNDHQWGTLRALSSTSIWADVSETAPALFRKSQKWSFLGLVAGFHITDLSDEEKRLVMQQVLELQDTRLLMYILAKRNCLTQEQQHNFINETLRRRRWQLIEQLLDLHALQPSHVNEVLVFSAGHKRWEVFLTAFRKGADIYQPCTPFPGLPVIHYVMRFKDFPIRSLFLAGRADVVNMKYVDSHGATVLHHAIFHKVWGNVKVLLDHGADINLRGGSVLTPLEWLIDNEREDLIVQVVRGGHRPVWRPGKDGVTVLHLLCRRNLLHDVKLLAKHGADITAVTDDGKTLLDFCVSRGNRLPSQLITWLVRQGLGTHHRLSHARRHTATVSLLKRILLTFHSCQRPDLPLLGLLWRTGTISEEEIHKVLKDEKVMQALQEIETVDVVGYLQKMLASSPHSLYSLCCQTVSHFIGCDSSREARCRGLLLPPEFLKDVLFESGSPRVPRRGPAQHKEDEGHKDREEEPMQDQEDERHKHREEEPMQDQENEGHKNREEKPRSITDRAGREQRRESRRRRRKRSQ